MCYQTINHSLYDNIIIPYHRNQVGYDITKLAIDLIYLIYPSSNKQFFCHLMSSNHKSSSCCTSERLEPNLFISQNQPLRKLLIYFFDMEKNEFHLMKFKYFQLPIQSRIRYYRPIELARNIIFTHVNQRTWINLQLNQH